MNPIYLLDNKEEGNIGINANEFSDRLLKICEEHRKTNQARIFAFALTDFHTL